MVLNEHYFGDGALVFAQACKLGCEASCRSGSARRTAAAAPNWIKVKNPAAPAVQREPTKIGHNKTATVACLSMKSSARSQAAA
jgi:hypothetical protein